jgi:peptidyl-prolyl cis-trans isomerase B (cyclophilin B)
VRGKKAKQLRVDRTAEREAARRKQRQQTLFTIIVIAIIVGIGGVLVAVSLNPPADVAADPSESPGASEAPDDRGVACEGEAPANAGETKPTFSEPEQVLEDGTDYGAVIQTSCGKITVDLYEEESPTTVNSFVFLAQEGFFDGLQIFRNATSIGALQTGAGTNEATFDIGYKINDELEAAEADKYPPGTLAMANSGPDSAGSQFFFVYNDKFELPPTYAVFGKANAAGLKTLERIGKIPVTDPSGQDPAGAEQPSQITYMESVKITTK